MPAAETFDLIPADALGGVACRSIEGLVKKSAKHAKDLEFPLPEDPAKMCGQVFAFLGISDGLDKKAGCSLVVVNKKHIGAELQIGIFGGKSNLDQYFVFAIPFTDLDVMAGNFGIAKGKLKPETVVKSAKEHEFIKLCYARGKHIYLGGNEKAILSVAKGKTLGEDIGPVRRKSLAAADCLCHLGTEVWDDIHRNVVRGVDNAFDHIKDEKDRRTAREFVKSLAAVRHIIGACTLDNGFGCSCMCVLPTEGAVEAKKK